MALTLTKRPDPAKIYVAWQSFSVHGVADVVQRGTRLRGNNPAVERAFQYFVEDGVPESEWPSVLDAAVEQAAAVGQQWHAEQAQRQPKPIADNEAAEAIESFSVGGRSITVGDRLRRDDPIVKANKSFFATPRRPLA